MKNKVITYYCTGRTEATDRANLYYIASPTARGMQTDKDKITVTGRNGKPLAIFLFCAQ